MRAGTASSGRRWLECFSELITKSAPPGSTITVLSKAKLSFPKVAPRMAAYRLVVGVAPEGAAASVKLYLDRVLLGADRANVSTIMFSVGKPYSAAFEQKLAGRSAGASASRGPMGNSAGPDDPQTRRRLSTFGRDA